LGHLFKGDLVKGFEDIHGREEVRAAAYGWVEDSDFDQALKVKRVQSGRVRQLAQPVPHESLDVKVVRDEVVARHDLARLEVVAKHIEVDFVIVLVWSVIEMPGVVVKEREQPLEYFIWYLDLLAVRNFELVWLEQSTVEIGHAA